MTFRFSRTVFALFFLTITLSSLPLSGPSSSLFLNLSRADDCLERFFAENHSILKRNDFVVGRGIEMYNHYFGVSFRDLMENLPYDSHWVDSGAGNAFAFWQAATSPHLNIHIRNLTAIGIEKPTMAVSLLPGRNFRYLEGRYLEDIRAEEIGSADVITDVYGPFAYSAAIDQILRKYLEILKVGGSAFIFFDSYKTNVGGTGDGLGNYLRSIEGAEIEWLPRITWDGPIAFRLRKTSKDVQVPGLHLDNFVAGRAKSKDPDPWRWYQR